MVIPYTNRSAQSMQDTRKQIPQKHMIQSRSGERYLPYGDRRTDPADQGGADPDEYENPGGYVLKNGAESRNLNRTYPGKADGTPTEQLSYAIIALIDRNRSISASTCMRPTPRKDNQDDGDYTRRQQAPFLHAGVPSRGLEMRPLPCSPWKRTPVSA